MPFSEGWTERQRILIILAHPDDPEFFCGATIARWTASGHEVTYYLLTRGDKGSSDRNVCPEDLAKRREIEQSNAAAVLGVKQVSFLQYLDGCLVPSLDIRREITRIIRREKPDILVSSDPTNYFPNELTINHPDHRAAGQIVCESFFPGVGNPMFFKELLDEELEPHQVKEVWLTLTSVPNTIIDVTDTWEIKIKALHEHVSQIADPIKLDERIRGRRTPDSTPESPRYEEKFRRFLYR
jgi:LmbE family N-acetylglucosaminyl deacetylase